MNDTYLIKQNFSAICLVSSAGCNLNCKYCEIAKSKNNEYSKELQEKIKKAFEDGTFLKNVKTTYQTLHQNFNNITFLNLWGQEPTLTLDSFRSNLSDWFKIFPNINEIFFSTNGGNDPYIIYNFICDLDSILTHKLDLEIQFSYDGEWSCLNERMIDPNLIKNNFTKLIQLVNNTKLNYIKLNFCWHAVLNFNLIHHLLKNNGIKEYLQDLDNMVFYAYHLNQNSNCKISPMTLGLEQPYQACTDDGLALATFLEKSLRIDLNYKFYFGNPIKHLLHNLIGRMNYENRIFENNDGLWTQTLINAFNSTEDNSAFLEGATCGSYKTELKFMYDGTIVGCQNFLFNTKKEYINDTNPTLRSIKENAIDHNMFINFTDPKFTKEDFDRVFNKFEIFHYKSFLATYQSILNIIIFLADAGQASTDYLINKEKLFKHALMVVRFNMCLFNHLTTTGSIFLEPIHLCRVLCNGALDIAEQYYINSKGAHNE